MYMYQIGGLVTNKGSVTEEVRWYRGGYKIHFNGQPSLFSGFS